MNSFRFVDKKTGYLAAAFALLLAFVVPALAFAAQVTERSIALSNSSADADGVAYEVKFKSVGAAGAFVVDFCSNSPLIGSDCVAPVGFSATNAASATSGFTDVSDLDANTVVVAGTIAADTAITVNLTGINNPTAAGPLYARIVTFDTDAHADLYTSTDIGEDADVIDEGGVAMSITPTIGVSGAVLESMTFCIGGSQDNGVAPGENCSMTGVKAPTLKLGQDNGGVIALDALDVYTGDVYTQLSTNAVSGAVVYLKSSAAGCGGLIRAGAPSAAAGCGIAPALATNITLGQAKFGVKVAAATDVGSNSNGALRAFGGGTYYSDSVYKMNYIAGDATGVTSTYGDPFLDTNNAPVNNKAMTVTFGASAANNTPAGLYSADLSMIATGKF